MTAVIIAIDGPAGAGKSTVGKAVARRLGLEYLDTGAMYRAVAFAALRRGLPVTDDAAVAELARAMDLSVTEEGVFVDGVDATDRDPHAGGDRGGQRRGLEHTGPRRAAVASATMGR